VGIGDRPAVTAVRRLVVAVAVLAAGIAPAHAHTTSTALAVVVVVVAAITYRLTLVVTELSGTAREAFASAARGDPAASAHAVELLRDRIVMRSPAGPCLPAHARIRAPRRRAQEAGQAVVIALVLPVFVRLRHLEREGRVRRALSITVATVGVVWFVRRLFFE
jgi:hypothetical protein